MASGHAEIDVGVILIRTHTRSSVTATRRQLTAAQCCLSPAIPSVIRIWNVEETGLSLDDSEM